MQQMEIWLVMLFLLGKKYHAWQIVLLSSSMKLGPELKDVGKQISFTVRVSYFITPVALTFVARLI